MGLHSTLRNRCRLAGAAVVIATAAYGCARSSGTAGARPARHDVTIRQIAFQPAALDAAPGDTVVWHNRDIVPHTVSAADHAWDSGNLPPDSSFSLVVPPRDSLPYGCRYHTNMHGIVRVARTASG